MRMKKLMAALLAAAMVLTSQSFSADVFAAEPDAVQVEAVDEAVTAETVADDDPADETEVIIPASEEESSEEETEALEEEETVEAIELEEEGLDEEIAGADDYFERTTTLTIKTGAQLASTVTVPKETEVIPAGIFDKHAEVKEVKFEEGSALNTIDAAAFKGSGLEKISIPAGVTVIEDEVFKNSTKLAEVSFEGPVTKIGDGAFANTHLSTIECATVTEIGAEAFRGCTYLDDVVLSSLKKIGESAFQGCSRTETKKDGTTELLGVGGGFEWPANLESIGDNAFMNCAFEAIDFHDLMKVTTLGNNVFASNTKLKNVVDSSCDEDGWVQFTEMTSGLFMDCTALENIKIPDSVTTISANAFSGCSSIKTIKIPSKVTSIASKAFDGCTSLTLIEIAYNGVGNVDIYPDAFPLKSGVTMKGFNGKVQDYANYRGYTFESLAEARTIEKKATSCTIVTVPEKPRAGETVTVKILPLQGYALTDVYYEYINSEGTKTSPACKYLRTEDSYVIFEFTMPNATTSITATAQGGAALSLNPKIKIEQVDGYDLPANSDNLKDGDIISWTTRGNKAKMNVKLTSISGQQKYHNWLFNFTTSDNTKVVPTSSGEFYGVGYGDAVITATYKYNKNIKFSFTVNIADDVKIMSALFDPADLRLGGRAVVTAADPYTGYPVITINKAVVEKADMTFDVSMKAYTEEDQATNRVLESTWSTTDSTIAVCKSSKSKTNTNIITVKKGSQGEAQIAAYVLNTNETEPNTLYKDEGEDNIAHLIIRVVDVTPRLGDKEITVNNQIVRGTKIDVVPVYGYEINDDVGLKVCYKKTVNGVTSYTEECKDLEAVFDPASGDVYLRTTSKLNGELKLDASKLYSGNLYLCGEYKYNADQTIHGDFQIAIPKVTIINKKLSPRLSVSGKINLFYNETASVDELGTVKITESITDTEIVDYELVSAVNYKNPNSEAPDKFANNFTIVQDPVYPEKIEIQRSTNALAKDVNKKDVLSGYLYIYFAGYREPCKVALTVPTCVTAPVYYLSKTTATANYSAKGQEYQVYLYPAGKANKIENAVDLSKFSHLAFSNLTQGATTANFNKDKDVIQAKAASDNLITLKIPDDTRPKAGTATIALKMSTWADSSKTLFYTFRLNVSKTKPTAKTTAVNRIFNKAFSGGNYEQVIEVFSSDPDAWITDLDSSKITWTDPGNRRADAFNAILAGIDTGLFATNGSDDDANVCRVGRGYIKIKLDADDPDIKVGDYSFKIEPEISYVNNVADGTAGSTGVKVDKPAAITFRVSIQNVQPSLRLGTGTFAFNSQSEVVDEKITTSLTASGILANSVFKDEYDLDFSDIKVWETKERVKDDTNNLASNFEIEFEPDVAEQKIYVKTTSDFERDAYHTKTYLIRGIKVIHSDGDEATARDLTVTVRGNYISPVVTATQSGQLNVITADATKLKYVSKVSYVNASVTDVEVYDVDESGDTSSTVSDKFFITRDAENQNITYLQIQPSALTSDPQKVKPNTNYRIVLRYYLDVTNGANQYYDVNFIIKPVQMFPGLVLTPNWGYMYAGANQLVNDPTDTLKKQKVIAELEMPKNFAISGCEIVGLEWGKGIHKSVPLEFYKPVLLGSRTDAKTGKVYYKFQVSRRNAAEMRQNETYYIGIAPIFKYQDTDTVSTPYILKIHVRK